MAYRRLKGTFKGKKCYEQNAVLHLLFQNSPISCEVLTGKSKTKTKKPSKTVGERYLTFVSIFDHPRHHFKEHDLLDLFMHVCLSVCLVPLVCVQTDNFHLIRCQQTDKQQTFICTMSKP